MPCSTCEERGIVCEGLTDRKRPRRNPEKRSRASSARGERRSSRDSGLDEDGGRSQRNSFDSSLSRTVGGNEHLQRPTAHLLKLGTQDSEDSGYASGLQSAHESSTTLQLETKLSMNYRFAPSYGSGCDYSTDMSPTAIDPNSNLPGTRESPNTLAIDSGVSSALQTAATSGYPNVAAWPDRRGRFTTCANDSSAGQATTRLLSAAQTLEQQAQSLRKLASHPCQESADDTRRQTIALPIYNESPAALYDSNQLPFGSFDDLSLIFGERTSGSGLTPLPVDFNSLWDVNPSLSSSLGFSSGPISNPQSGAMPDDMERASGEWSDLPNLYNVASGAARSREISNNIAAVQEQKPTTSEAAMYCARPQHGYQQLYPWPE